MKNILFNILLALPLLSLSVSAQYCTPSALTTGTFINDINFNVTNITGGSTHPSTSNSYTNNSGVSAGSMNRTCQADIRVNMNSCGNRGAKNVNLRVFADWNRDNDFDDAGEIIGDIDDVIPNGNCAALLKTVSVIPPITASGNIRLRIAIREGGVKATACGTGFIGEFEDYTLVVNPNNAPALSAAGTPYINSLYDTDVNNEGFSVLELLRSAKPDAVLYADADPCTPYKGIAVNNSSATNGQWQYKTGVVPWTGIGAVSSSNALLISADPDHFIRFVPTGTGVPTITFRDWDQTTGIDLTYANITGTGGATAYSTNSRTVPLNTISSASGAGDVKVYIASQASDYYGFLLESSSLTRAAGTLKQYRTITTGGNNSLARDIDLDQVNNKLLWIGGPNGTAVMRSSLTGTNLETIFDGTFVYPTGIAVGAGSIYVADYGNAIFKLPLDGSTIDQITGGSGQMATPGATGDIEFFNNRIYFVNDPNQDGHYGIYSTKTDGTDPQTIYTTTNLLGGLSVANNLVYFTETSSTNEIKSVSITGGAASVLVTEANRNFLDVATDVANGWLYILDADPAAGAEGTIRRAPISGGATVKVLELLNAGSGIALQISQAELPVHFMQVQAEKKSDATIGVSWKVAAEENVSHYDVERSINGTEFKKIGEVAAINKPGYNYVDVSPLPGPDYYRVRSVDNDGFALYSLAVLVNLNNSSSRIRTYPTIVSNGSFVLELTNMEKGKYQLQLVSEMGQFIYSKEFSHAGGSNLLNIPIGNSGLLQGYYHIVLRHDRKAVYSNALFITN